MRILHESLVMTVTNRVSREDGFSEGWNTLILVSLTTHQRCE